MQTITYKTNKELKHQIETAVDLMENTIAEMTVRYGVIAYKEGELHNIPEEDRDVERNKLAYMINVLQPMANKIFRELDKMDKLPYDKTKERERLL